MSHLDAVTSEDVPSSHGPPSPEPTTAGTSPTEVGRQVEPGQEEGGDVGQGEKLPPQQQQQQSRRPSTRDIALRHLSVLGLLTFSSIWGTLAREGLIALNTYDGRSISPTIWAQAVGCLVMGWTVANKPALEQLYPPLFIMLGTGFCGSVTTFSSWILQVFQAYGNQLHHNRTGLHNVMDALTQTAATLGMSIVSLQAGRSLAGVISVEKITRRRRGGESKNSGHTPFLDTFCFIVLGLGFWLGAALLAAFQTHPQFRPTTFAIVFSPPGAILRWYLSRWNSIPLSKKWPHWPLGTFTANIFATIVVAAVFVAQHFGRTGTHLAAKTVLQCHVLFGLQEGFCGCLSTLSTFAVELRNLKPRRRAFGYAVGSYVIGMAFCVVIIGAPWWSRGMDGSCLGIITYHT